MFPGIHPTTTLPFNGLFPSSVAAFTSGRGRDFSLAAGQETLSPSQRAFLKEQLGFDLPFVFNVRQVHGSNIVAAEKENIQKGFVLEEADGIVTDVCYLPLAVRTADCVPAFIYDPRRHCMGLFHAGWKGSLKGIAGQVVVLMGHRWGTRAEDLKVAFGPAIKSCCYEVGAEFCQYFPGEVIERQGRHYLDLAGVNKRQLMKLGVPEGNIVDSEACTCCDRSYYSYRREGAAAGRMISLMMLRD